MPNIDSRGISSSVNYCRSLLILALFILLGALFFYPAFKIGFLGDFAGDFFTSQFGWFDFAAYQWNFYLPVMMLYYCLYKAFHLWPLPYQVFHLALIFINAWLVYLLAQELQFKSWQCWIAGLLALFNSAAFETYYWLSTIPKVLATSFGLMALIFLCRLRQRLAWVWAWGYLIMVTLGMAIESTGLILPLLGLILDSHFGLWRESGKGKSTLFAGLKLHLWSFSITGVFLVVRHFLGIKPYAENLPVIQKFLTFGRTILSTFSHGLSDHLWLELKGIPVLPVILTLLLSTILLMAWYVKHGPDKSRFITLLLLWLGASLPHTIGSHFHSRYLYFPGVFAALVLAELMGSFRLHRWARHGTRVAVALVVIGYLAWDGYFFRQSLSNYLEASRIYDAGIKKIKTNLPEIPPGSRLLLIDFPDKIIRPRHIPQGNPTRYRVLIYRNALPHHLNLLYQKPNINLTMVRLSPPSDDNPDPLGTPSSPEEVAKLAAAPQTMTCRYLSGDPGKFVIVSNTVRHDSPIIK